MYLYLLDVYHTMLYSIDFFVFIFSQTEEQAERKSHLGCLMMLGCNLIEKRLEIREIMYEMDLDVMAFLKTKLEGRGRTGLVGIKGLISEWLKGCFVLFTLRSIGSGCY